MSMTLPCTNGESPVAIVTAASRGIGQATALKLAHEGYRLALLARGNEVEVLAKDIGALAVVGSVTDPDDLQRLVETTVAHYGRIDAVVNNTGHAPSGQLLELSDMEWMAGVDMYLLNVVRMTRLVVPEMLAAGRGGAIVNVSSLSAAQPDQRFLLSSTLRGALPGIAKLFAAEFAGQDLRMNNLLPGRVSPQPEDRIANVPAGRAASSNEIANMIAFLLSPGAAYVNGQSLIIDGGLSATV